MIAQQGTSAAQETITLKSMADTYGQLRMDWGAIYKWDWTESEVVSASEETSKAVPCRVIATAVHPTHAEALADGEAFLLTLRGTPSYRVLLQEILGRIAWDEMRPEALTGLQDCIEGCCKRNHVSVFSTATQCLSCSEMPPEDLENRIAAEVKKRLAERLRECSISPPSSTTDASATQQYQGPVPMDLDPTQDDSMPETQDEPPRWLKHTTKDMDGTGWAGLRPNHNPAQTTPHTTTAPTHFYLGGDTPSPSTTTSSITSIQPPHPSPNKRQRTAPHHHSPPGPSPNSVMKQAGKQRAPKTHARTTDQTDGDAGHPTGEANHRAHPAQQHPYGTRRAAKIPTQEDDEDL
mmetsp:Transcript_27358/g.71043  ORF Transcript_27358/g.71043 Transcript_27358/m.71043 type:complete len:350 (-) Transcript_27358:110-1159(-)